MNSIILPDLYEYKLGCGTKRKLLQSSLYEYKLGGY